MLALWRRTSDYDPKAMLIRSLVGKVSAQGKDTVTCTIVSFKVEIHPWSEPGTFNQIDQLDAIVNFKFNERFIYYIFKLIFNINMFQITYLVFVVEQCCIRNCHIMHVYIGV